MGHRPANQGANQPGIDRDFVIVENSGHSRSQSHSQGHGNQLSSLDPVHPYRQAGRQSIGGDEASDLVRAELVITRAAPTPRVRFRIHK